MVCYATSGKSNMANTIKERTTLAFVLITPF
jgi:hypothetical protein